MNASGKTLEEEAFKLSTMTVGQVNTKRRGAPEREQQVPRSSGERARKHLETERTLRLGLPLGRGESGEMRAGMSSSSRASGPR